MAVKASRRKGEGETIERSDRPRPTTPAAVVTALGIVFGDLGTSPLYTFPAIAKALGGEVDAQSALGILSLIVWTLIITVSIKYCLLLMRADNHGEGGILALMASTRLNWQGRQWPLIACGLFGAALIYGDGVITPAISVLSALEGVNVATDTFAPYVMPAAVAVLATLFAVQRLGTASVGKAFGPVMLVWFVAIAVLGLVGIGRNPAVLAAADPSHAILFLVRHGWLSMAVLGAVFLAVTGGEALYADMGHIGRGPIRVAWFALVLPALLINYAGQTALYLDQADASGSPFFRLAPPWALYPLVALATMATVIASQAIITGAFSLTRQAMQLGWFPGVRIQQTSSDQYGQIYVSFINWTMMLLTIALTASFGSSDRLAGAYGTAVATTMVLTTVLLYHVMRSVWHWQAWKAVCIFSTFMVVDFAFFAANLLKIAEGGWIPLLLGAVIVTVMITWRSGIDAIHHALHRRSVPFSKFRTEVEDHPIRSSRTAIFLTRLAHDVPSLIVDHVRQIGVVPKVIIALSVHFTDHPRVAAAERINTEELCRGFWHVVVRYGFMEIPDIPATLRKAREQGFELALGDAIYYAERDRPVAAKRRPRMARWRRALFAFLLRNAVHAVDLFKLPPRDFVELGREIEI